MLSNYVCIISAGFLSALGGIALLRRLTARYTPLTLSGVPQIGGIAMGVSFIVSSAIGFLLLGYVPQAAQGIIIASSAMLVFGIVDDLKELSILYKFLAQIIAASVLILFGVRTHIVYIGNISNVVITFIWILGITNAFNHLDVIDGLAGGAAFVVSTAFFSLSLLNGNSVTCVISLSLAAGILCFLLFNVPPAKIYMGNAGSHFLGFVLAALALVTHYASLERKIALLSPLLILGLPIFDTTFLVVARVAKKKVPFKKSDDHIALRLLAAGHSKTKAVWSLLMSGLFFALCGIAVSQVTLPYCIITIIGAILVGAVLLNRALRIGNNG